VFESPTKINYRVLERYERLLSSLKENNIKTFVTLQHHTLPKWLSKGWENPEIEKRFEEYAKVVGKSLHKYVDAWLPINEPAVNCMMGYLLKLFPPGKSSHLSVIRATRNQMRSYFRVYHTLKNISAQIPVGFVKQMMLFKPHRKKWTDKALRCYFDYSFNGVFINAFKNSRLPFSLKKIQGLSESIDFWAVNYYTHKWVSIKLPQKRRFHFDNTTEVSQMGWEWDPEGLQTVIKRLWNINRKPIYITENGIAVTEDSKRKLYIYLHLKSILKSLSKNIDIRGYFYWSLLDNFEWNHGYKPNFGLAGVNSNTFLRLPRPSGYYLKEIAKERKLIDPAMINKGC
jgi:beta-glucosidase